MGKRNIIIKRRLHIIIHYMFQGEPRNDKGQVAALLEAVAIDILVVAFSRRGSGHAW
jgi:hypothetical protein